MTVPRDTTWSVQTLSAQHAHMCKMQLTVWQNVFIQTL